MLDNNSGSFVLLGPNVHDNHDLPSLIDRNIFNPRGIQAGEYTLTIGDKQAGGAQVCNPVGGGEVTGLYGRKRERRIPGTVYTRGRGDRHTLAGC